jgi:hypothetical protein
MIMVIIRDFQLGTFAEKAVAGAGEKPFTDALTRSLEKTVGRGA